MYRTSETSGLSTMSVAVENLKPSTNYVLVVNGSYTKDEALYNRDFIQKAFVTSSVGVTLAKNYFTTDTLSFYLNKETYSEVESVEVKIMDLDGNLIENQKVTFNENKKEVIFDELDRNTSYKIQVYNFLYNNSIVADLFTMDYEYRTLKTKPTFGDPSFVIDKKNGIFTIELDEINDLDNGIESLQYKIYSALDTEEGSEIQIIEKTNKASSDLKVDGTLYSRNKAYQFKVVAIFNDNEKEYEYETGFSSIMQMDGKTFPTITFTEGTEHGITFERIEGTLNINDPEATIDRNSNFKIIYSDSVGTSKTVTAGANSRIAIDFNNLRQNESYTITLIGNINLADGNPNVTDCVIGSLTVQTKKSNPLTAQMGIKSTEISNAFDVTLRLIDTENEDTSLEINTLTGITVNLYKGDSTDTINKIGTYKLFDTNTMPYVSTIKDRMYNTDIELTPETFGLLSTDDDVASAQSFTFEVTNAYDYTNYPNVFGVLNNTFNVRSNGTIPGIPQDENKRMSLGAVYNSTEPPTNIWGTRGELDATTIIGYSFKANYDNSAKYAKKIHYYIYDYDYSLEEPIYSVDYEVPTSGSISYMKVPVSDGIDYDQPKGNGLRRGNRYVFGYTIELDTNYDGTVNYLYSMDGLGDPIKSQMVWCPKQTPYIKSYPSNFDATNKKLTYKFFINDIDHAISGPLKAFRKDTNEIGSMTISDSRNWNTSMTFTWNTKDTLTFKVNHAIYNINATTSPSTKVFGYQTVDFTKTFGELAYETSVSTNKIMFELLDFQNNAELRARAIGAKVRFYNANHDKTIDNAEISEDSGIISVDLTDIEEFLGENFNTDVQVYYDNGSTGFDLVDTNNYGFAMKQITNESFDGRYMYSDDTGENLIASESAARSKFEITSKNFDDGRLTIKSKYNNIPMNLDVSAGDATYELYGVPFYFKGVSLSTKVTNGPSKFESIVPCITLYENNRSTLRSQLVTASYKPTLSGITAGSIKDDKIYVKLYETDQLESFHDLVEEKSISVGSFSGHVQSFENLKASTNYYFIIGAYLSDGQGGYNWTQLYDFSEASTNTKYYFKTLGDIGVSNIKLEYKPVNYSNKYFELTYNLDQTSGFNSITYTLYKLGASGEYEEVILDDVNVWFNYASRGGFAENMSVILPIEEGIMQSNKNYKVVIRAFYEDGTNSLELTKNNQGDPAGSHIFMFKKLSKPYVGVSAGFREENLETGVSEAIIFTTKSYDSNKVMVNDEYVVQLLDMDNNDITPEGWTKTASAENFNNRYIYENFVHGTRYKMRLYYTENLFNDYRENLTQTYYEWILDTSSEGISVGNIETTTNISSPYNITLSFYNSYRLEEINMLEYSIIAADGTPVCDATVEFTPTLTIDSGGNTYYYFMLNDLLEDSGTYVIQLHFLKDNEMISEESVQYLIIGN